VIEMNEYCGVWKDPVTGRIFKSPQMGVFEAQMILPEDISAIQAQVVLEEVLGLARQA